MRPARSARPTSPPAHFLESWGDHLTADGLYLSQQPLILPLYGGLSENDVIAFLAGLPSAKGAEFVRETFAQMADVAPNAGQAFDSAWHAFVHDGFLPAVKGGLPFLGGAARPPPRPITARRGTTTQKAAPARASTN